MNTDHAPSAGFVDFKKVKSSVEMLQVLERYKLTETFKRNGDRLSGPCPIHKGKNPTAFRVSLDKNCFNCFGSCGRGGNVIDFVALMEEVDFRKAALLLQEWFMDGGVHGDAKRPEPRATKARHPERPTPAANNDETEASDADGTFNPPLTFQLKTLDITHRYLEERGLNSETRERFGLGYCNRGMLRGHIAIPIHNRDGQLVAYAGRWPGEPPEGNSKYKFPKGFHKSMEIFNIHRALQEDEALPLVVVEGFFDCFALWQAGIAKCVALMGSSISADQERLLCEALAPDGSIEILFDNDEAGNHGADQLLERLGGIVTTRIIRLPEGIRQPDDLDPDDIAEVFA